MFEIIGVIAVLLFGLFVSFAGTALAFQSKFTGSKGELWVGFLIILIGVLIVAGVFSVLEVSI
jgi:hypothetical protein